MNHILKLYYGMEVDVSPFQYFTFHQNIYYLTCFQDNRSFFEIYQYYRYFMQQCGYQGYTIVLNAQEAIESHQHILLQYHKESFDFQIYLHTFLTPLPIQRLPITHIKEQWICKIDRVKELVKHYAYSFQHNPDLVSLIYYYAGIGENCISILNEILSMDKNATISMGLSLKYPITEYVYDVLNPCHYIISTRMRHLVYLIKSHLLSYDMFNELLEKQYFDIYEIYYFYARFFFPSTFFDDILCRQLSKEEIEKYYQIIEQDQFMYVEMTKILSFYISLPKISWINRKNML